MVAVQEGPKPGPQTGSSIVPAVDRAGAYTFPVPARPDAQAVAPGAERTAAAAAAP